MSKPKYVIVVGVDYSKASELALDEAFTFAAAKPGAQLHVVNVQVAPGLHAVPLGQLSPVPPWQDWAIELRDWVDLRVRAFRVHTSTAPFQQLFTHQRMDDPAQGIVQLAVDMEADLVVVGTEDRHGLSRMLLGSVAEAVTRLAPCPVLVMRAKSIPEPGPVIEPPCPRCVAARQASNGVELWCEQHRERHGHRHTYHQGDRVGAETNFPLVSPS